MMATASAVTVTNVPRIATSRRRPAPHQRSPIAPTAHAAITAPPINAEAWNDFASQTVSAASISSTPSRGHLNRGEITTWYTAKAASTTSSG